jgi:hypothetical protein
MSNPSQESRIILAINALEATKKLSVLKAVSTYNMPKSLLRYRIKGRTSRTEYRPKKLNLNETEEEVIVQYILDKYKRGFALRINNVGDIADLILKSRGACPVGKQ